MKKQNGSPNADLSVLREGTERSERPTVPRVLAFIFVAWTLAQTINLFTLPLEDALGAYTEIASGQIIRLALFLIVTAALSYKLMRKIELPELALLSGQVLFTAIALRSPLLSLSIGLLLLNISMTVLILRLRKKAKPASVIISLSLLATTLLKLLYNALFVDFESDSTRFKHYFAEEGSINLGWSFVMILVLLLSAGIALYMLLKQFKRLKVARRFGTLHRQKRELGYLIIIGSALLWLCLAYIMCVRTMRIVTPTYDMGIFTQMYQGILKSGQPLTTVERDKVLSHFAVHFSPILYLITPIFYLFPDPLTLQIVQLLIAASAVIPLVRIAKRLRLPQLWAYLASGLLMAAPQLLGSNLYDFHENCFLAPLILWLIDALLARKKLRTLIFALLTLMVKEDAVVYVFCLGLWTLSTWPKRQAEGVADVAGGAGVQLVAASGGARVETSARAEMSAREEMSARQEMPVREETERRDRLFVFLTLLVLPLLWFLLSTQVIRHLGGEPMLDRFANLSAFKGSGVPGVALTLILHPVPAIASLFTEGKIFYIMAVMSGFAFLPLLQKRAAHYFLLLPMAVINLLPSWRFQHDLHFQYGYGSVALLAFAALVFLSDFMQQLGWTAQTVAVPMKRGLGRLRLNLINMILCVALLFSMFFSLTYLLLPKMLQLNSAVVHVEKANEMREVLAEIPRDKKLLVSSVLVAEMADIDELYVIEYHVKKPDTSIDYVILDQRFSTSNSWVIKTYTSADYTQSELSTEELLILEKP